MSAPDTVQFHHFQFVWMRIDEDGSSPGMGQVVGILYKPNSVLYQIQWGSMSENYHYAEELTDQKPTPFTSA